MRRLKPRPRVGFKDEETSCLFKIRDCIRELSNLGIKDKYLENVQKEIVKELERRAR